MKIVNKKLRELQISSQDITVKNLYQENLKIL